jgi:cation:H+ antiporter
MMIIATLILSFFAFNGIIDYISGILMISLVIIYIFYSLYKNAGENNSDEINNLPSGNKNNFRLKKLQKNIKEVGVGKNIRLLLDSVSNLSINKSIFFIIFGIFLLIFGSNNFLSGAISIAEIYNIPQEIIGLGIVAFGSSLPELTTAIVASLKKQGSLIIGNIIGSNIFNILSIIGVISIIDDIILPLHISKFDIWTLLVITIFFSLILKYKNHISKKMGALFIASYLCYIIHIF